MNFLIADTFTASFNRLLGQDQKAVKASVFDLQTKPTNFLVFDTLTRRGVHGRSR